MKITCFSNHANCAVSCFIIIRTFTLAHGIVEDVRSEKFRIKGSTRILQTEIQPMFILSL